MLLCQVLRFPPRSYRLQVSLCLLFFSSGHFALRLALQVVPRPTLRYRLPIHPIPSKLKQGNGLLDAPHGNPREMGGDRLMNSQG